MDYFEQYVSQFRNRLLFLFLVSNLLLVGVVAIGTQLLAVPVLLMVAVAAAWSLLASLLFALLSARYLSQPTLIVWQAILHLLPESERAAAPKPESAPFGVNLLTRMLNDIYRLTTDEAHHIAQLEASVKDIRNNEPIAKLPVPYLTLNQEAIITYANPAGRQYLQLTDSDVGAKNFYTLFDLAFADEQTMDSWLQNARQNSVRDMKSWFHVRTTLLSGKTIQFDLAASYSKDDPSGNELSVVFFDRTNPYESEDTGFNFIALAVHELRTPLSLLLGYIEALEEELRNQLDPAQAKFLLQMKSAGQNLSAFVTNILTVVRIENNQLELKLTEENWAPIVTQAVRDMQVRARVNNIQLELAMPPTLPTVGVNPVTASEVLLNLIDNAIKYSRDNAKDRRVLVHVGINQEGLIETTVQDFGVGIPTAVIPMLFQKFQRNFRNQMNISGTGLGLYLSRLIVEAHGGNIWVRSIEGQGATFGFTLQPYSRLASELKNGNNTDIIRSAHGWVKNHSLYRN